MFSQLGSPFHRVDPSRDSSTGGMGLGLSIARRALQLHYGTLAVSRPPGDDDAAWNSRGPPGSYASRQFTAKQYKRPAPPI
ncbi:MAG: ATP-binding protein [Acidobacteriota bacterium]